MIPSFFLSLRYYKKEISKEGPADRGGKREIVYQSIHTDSLQSWGDLKLLSPPRASVASPGIEEYSGLFYQGLEAFPPAWGPLLENLHKLEVPELRGQCENPPSLRMLLDPFLESLRDGWVLEARGLEAVIPSVFSCLNYGEARLPGLSQRKSKSLRRASENVLMFSAVPTPLCTTTSIRGFRILLKPLFKFPKQHRKKNNNSMCVCVSAFRHFWKAGFKWRTLTLEENRRTKEGLGIVGWRRMDSWKRN